MKKLYGVTTAMITPFDDNDKVDLQAMRNLVDFLIEKEVNCLYPLGTTGEMFRLTIEERKKIAQAVVEQANGRVPVFIHVGAMLQSETLELAKHAYNVGADGIGVVTPSYFSVNNREMEEYYTTVANSVPNDFPIYLYNIPQLSGNDLKPSVVKKIIERCPNIIGIKYSYPDFLITNDYLQLNDGKFSVLHGTDRLFIAALAMGCDGTVSGISCVFPEPFVALYKAFQEGDIEACRRYQKIANQYCETLKCGANMAYFKEALKIRGINGGKMRKPQLDLSYEEVLKLKQEIEKIEKCI
jgi:4-hydroxy-tetrahydrodipicolinate synthase